MRKKNSIKNFLTTFFPFVVVALFGFIRIKFYLFGLGEEISSLNQVFNNLFAYLAIAESGIGLFISQKYYKLLVDKNYDEINKNFKASKVFFSVLGFFVILIGFIISFFLKNITNNSLNLGYMQLVFFIFLLRNSIDFFTFSPKMVINSDQKMFKINLYINLLKVVEYLSEIIMIKLGFDFIYVLIPSVFIRAIFNLLINRKIYKLYPWLNPKVKFEYKKLKGTSNIMYQKVSGLVYNNTDTLIVSYFLNPLMVIVYSSYNFISKYISDVTYMLITAVQPSLGNVLFSENKTDSFKIFKQINIIFLFIASLSSILLAVLINPFISLWIGNKYLINEIGKYLIVLILFLNISKRTIIVMKDNLGLFKETRNVIIFETVFNLLFSILLVKKIGINGVLLGTLISTTLTTFWYIPKYIYNNYFDLKSYSYFIKYFICLGTSLVVVILIQNTININISNFFIWVIYALILGLITLLILILFFYVSFSEFKEVFKTFKGTFRNKLRRKNR